MRSRVTLLIALAALLATAPTAAAQSFPAPSLDLDPAYAADQGTSGIAQADFTGGTDFPTGVAIHGERTYTVGVTGSGDSQDVAIAARRPNGTLDPGFDGDGRLTVSIGLEAAIGRGIAVLPDGSLRVIVAVDRNTNSDALFDVAVVGLNSNGAPDTTFGTNVSGVNRVFLLEDPEKNEFPTRIEAAPDGRVAITGFRSDGTRDDLFVALLDREGHRVTGPAQGFGTTGVKTWLSPDVDDRGIDVVFRPGGGLIAWTFLDPLGTATDAGALRAFNSDGTPDTAFGTAGQLVVENKETIPRGLIVHAGRIWATGSTKGGLDTEAFLARVNDDSTGLQLRRFDMRGRLGLAANATILSQAYDLVAVPGIPDTLVAVGSVRYTFNSQDFINWAAAAFNRLEGDLQGAGFGDIVVPANWTGELASAAASPDGWVAVAGSHRENSDDSFGNARLFIDAEKACDLAVSASEPGEIVFRGSSPAALTVRVQNVGTKACGGTLTVPGPYGMAAIATGLVLPGATFVSPAVPVTYHGPLRADDVLPIDLAAPADANASNNRAAVHVVFSYCDLSVARAGPVGAIPSEGTRRFELSLRNLGTATCRVRVGSKEPYRLARGKTASDAVAVAAPAGARPGRRVPVVLHASAADDVDLRNNAVTVSPEVVRVGDSDVVSLTARRIAGTARRGAGELAASRLRPARVDVALLRKGGRRCSWLSSKNGTFDTVARNRDGGCRRPHWLRADGAANWELTLRKRLAPGTYLAYSRTTVRAGFSEARFSAKDRNRVEFTVR